MKISEQINFLDNITAVTLTVDEVRSFIDGDTCDKLDEVLDEAQGSVFSGKAVIQYVVIKVVKE